MTKRLYIILAMVAMVGCSESDIPTPGAGDDNAIVFSESPDNWGDTRGLELGESTFTEMEVYGYFTAEHSWAGAAKEDIATFMTKQRVTKQKSGEWSYSPTKYWSNNPANKISFFALAPLDEVEATLDQDRGKPIFKYTASQSTVENNDLVIDAAYDKSKGVASVDFEMSHALTKLTLKANLTGKGDDAAYMDIETFHIQDVTLTNLYSDAELTIDSDRALSWSIDESKTTPETVASHEYTLASVFDENNSTTGMNENTKLTTIPKSVMADNQAIFVLPQKLGTNRGKAAPTITISILRSYYASEADMTANKLTQIVYKTQAVVLPQPTVGGVVKEGWEIGMHNELLFTFDLDKLKEFDTPMTLTSEVRPWTEVDVDIDIHPNIYLYANTNEFELGKNDETADLYIYTNYDYDLRVPRSKFELDGSEITARGFTFYPNGATTAIAPLILNTDGSTITFETTTDGVTANDALLGYYGSDSEFGAGKFFNLEAFNATNVPGPDICHKDGTKIDIKWLRCRIKPTGRKAFIYYIGVTTRDELGLYTNSEVETASAGINRKGSDPVYILRLKVVDGMLTDVDGNALATDAVIGYFFGTIGAEMLVNSGGMITYKSDVSLQKTLN